MDPLKFQRWYVGKKGERKGEKRRESKKAILTQGKGGLKGQAGAGVACGEFANPTLPDSPRWQRP